MRRVDRLAAGDDLSAFFGQPPVEAGALARELGADVASLADYAIDLEGRPPASGDLLFHYGSACSVCGTQSRWRQRVRLPLRSTVEQLGKQCESDGQAGHRQHR